MLNVLAHELGVALTKRSFSAGPQTRAEVDGACTSCSPPILVEAWAHQGPPKSAQKAKVMTDALKLVWIESAFLPGARKVMLLSDDLAAAHFRGSSWMSAALRQLGIEVRVVDLPPKHRAAVKAAQDRQYR
jgi:hypothetical protein